jgi:predicted methyltransferase
MTMRQTFAAALIASAVAAAAPAAARDAQAGHGSHEAPVARAALKTALAAPNRTPVNLARDKHRHPAETLAFFGVDPGDTVVELWPGGGWYTEILAPYLATGTLHVVPPAGNYDERIRTKLKGDPVYGKVQVATFTAGQPTAVPAASADVVLTFRNVHSWLMSDQPIADAVFAEAFRMLKPGGTLGVVEHRLPEDADAAREKESGYVKTSTVKALAEKAGFRFVEASEVNANPRDKTDHPGGVWALPPTYRNKDVDRVKYEAIGESDRMTLKFVKPE